MRRQQLILSEQELHNLVEESVKIYLTENGLGEGVWGGLKNVGTGIKNLNFNLKGNFNAGNLSSSFQKYSKQAQQAITQMNTLAQKMQNPQIQQYLQNVSDTLKQTSDLFMKQAEEFAKGPQNAFSQMNNKQMQNMGYGKTLKLTNDQMAQNKAAAAGGTGAAAGGTGGTGAAAGGTGTVGGKKVPNAQNMEGLPRV